MRVNFFSLKTEEILARRLALGDWLGHHRVFTGAGIFAYLGVRKLVSDYHGGFWQQLQRGSISFRGDLGSGLHFYGLGARPCTCGLRQDSTNSIVDKNPPANAGDVGSIPGPGRSHMSCRETKPVCHNYGNRVPQLLKSLHLEPVLCNKGSHSSEEAMHLSEE